MTNTSLLKQYIDKSGYKKGFIAKKIGITTYALSQKVNNLTEFKASEINVLCELLCIDTENRMAIFFAQ